MWQVKFIINTFINTFQFFKLIWEKNRESGRKWRIVVSVQAFYSSVLPKTCDCDCVNPGVPHRLCLVSVEEARGSTQGLSSGHLTGWSNQRRSVGTSCLTGPWPWGARPMSGSCTVLWPTYQLMGMWQSCSHEAASTSPSNSSSTVCNVNL